MENDANGFSFLLRFFISTQALQEVSQKADQYN